MNHKLDTDTHVFFYEQEFYVLSNFSAFRLYWKGIDFDTSESAYHWEKFIDYPEAQTEILAARSAHDAFKVAQKYKEYRLDNWDEIKYRVMLDILREKVAQHQYVKKKLLETSNRLLVEDSWRDSDWGWGEDGSGQNMLGKLWMRVRDEIKGRID